MKKEYRSFDHELCMVKDHSFAAIAANARIAGLRFEAS